MRENRDENLIAELFSRQGYLIEKEPDGNVPPDMVLDKLIAVEVTRLSKIIETESLIKQIDNDSSSVIAKLKKSINTYELLETFNHKYEVVAIIKRPFGNLKKAMSILKSELLAIEKKGLTDKHTRIKISPSISIEVSTTSFENGKGCLLIGVIDLDDSFHDQDTILKSVDFCYRLKAKKIAPYLGRYKDWWLVLSDTITHDGSTEFSDYLARNICKAPFSRIILVNSLSGDIVSEI